MLYSSLRFTVAGGDCKRRRKTKEFEIALLPMSFKRSFTLTFLLGVCILSAFAAGYLVRAYQDAQATDFPVLAEAYNILRQRGYTPLPAPPAVEYGMIRGMIQAYGDPHTFFLEPPQAELESQSLSGKFGGIGVNLQYDQDGNLVIYPFPESPARQAGIQDGDRLTKVDDLVVTPQTPLETIQAAIRGPVGQTVTIAVVRPPDETPRIVTIKRQEIALPSTTWHLDASQPRLGVVRVNVIAKTTPDEILQAAKDLQSRGATALVLDLRDNGGGLLEAGVDTARLFLRDGVIMEQQYRGEGVKSFRVERPGPLADIPLAILVNHNTASACEIIAGALQVHRRAVIIGVPTYGKDTIQLVFKLQDDSSLHVTAAKWWVPGLEPPLAGNGLQPEIVVPADAAGPDPYMAAAIQQLFDKR